MSLSVAAIFTFIFETGGVAILGNKMDAAANKFIIGPVMDRYFNVPDVPGGLPINEMLGRALKTTNIMASNVLFNSFIEQKRRDSAERPWEHNGIDVDSLEAVFDVFLKEQLQVVNEYYPNLHDDPAYGKIEGLLAAARTNQESVKKFREELSLEVKTKFVDDLKKVTALSSLPIELEYMIFNGWYYNGKWVDWFELLTIHFADFMKNDQARPSLIAFQNRLLSDIKLDAYSLKIDMVDMFDKFEKNIELLSKENLRISKRHERKFDDFVRQFREDQLKLQNIKKGKFLNRIPGFANETVGRDEEMEELHEKLLSAESTCVINGLPGVGKSTFAKKYVKQFQDEFDHIIFLEIGFLAEHFSNQVNQIEVVIATDPNLEKYFIPRHLRKSSIQEKASVILNELQNLEGKNLFIVDTAEKHLSYLGRFLPNSKNWLVAITSRLPHRSHSPSIALAGLKPEDGKKLFSQYFEDTCDDTVLTPLLEKLNYHPLLIKLSARMLLSSCGLVSINEFAALLVSSEEDKQQLTPYNFQDGDEDLNIAQHTKRIFDVSNLGKHHIEMLVRFYLLPTRPISLQELLRIFQIEMSEKIKFRNEIFELTNKGWLTMTNQQFHLEGAVRTMMSLTTDLSEYRHIISKMASNLIQLN